MSTLKIFVVALVLGLFLLGSSACGVDPGSADEVAVIDTSYGKIVVEFFPKEAPRNVANFKQLARENFYEGTKFHRLVRDKGQYIAIQGGDPNTISGDLSTWGKGQANQKTVPAEFVKTLQHFRGMVSMARRGDDINSATSQFFICTTDWHEWDGKYSIFARVIAGMNVVDSIARAPMVKNSEFPVDPVVINKVTITKRDQVQALME
ncbi:MAG: peptidylprolyl isomerase [Acidobacteria bacterium]|nr:peptidylprolyl isomerase [Acidobacteriota bacterium]